MSSGIEDLLAPRTVAVVGASDKPGAYGGQTLLNLRRAGFPGAVYPVNPGRAGQLVHGLRCVASLEDLPERPDVTVVAVPAAAAVDVLTHVGQIGGPAAVVYAAGFAETATGVGRQQALIRVARDYRIAVCGPNGNGVVSVPHRAPLWGDSVELTEPGPVALISQSGNVGVNALAGPRGVALHSVVSCGNQAVLDAVHYLQHIAEHPDGVRAVALYLEADGDGARLSAALAACASRDIGVAVLKAGRSARGAVTGAAHTGSIAGDAAVFRALLTEAGAAWAHNPHELLEISGALATARRRRGRAAIVTCSGGDASVAADEADRIGLSLLDPSADTVSRLAALLPPGVGIANPLDYTSHLWADPAAIADVVRALAAQPDCGPVIGYIDTPPALDDAAAQSWRDTLAGFTDAAASLAAPVIVAATLPALLPLPIARSLAAAGVAPVAGLTTALRAAAALATAVPDPARLRAIAATAATATASGAVAGGWLAEHEAKDRLGALGITFPPGRVAASAEDAVAAADELGYPVVAKLSDPALQHKSDVGALALHLTDAAAVRAAATRLTGLGRPGVLLIEAMAAPGLELIVSVRRDAVVPCLVIGLGGIWTEVLADAIVLPLPTDRARVLAALPALRGYPLLAGGRGQPRLAVDALANLAVAAADALIAEHLTLIELNPVLVTASTAVAVDALVSF